MASSTRPPASTIPQQRRHEFASNSNRNRTMPIVLVLEPQASKVLCLVLAIAGLSLPIAHGGACFPPFTPACCTSMAAQQASPAMQVRYALPTCSPCLSSSKHHAICMRDGCVDLIDLIKLRAPPHSFIRSRQPSPNTIHGAYSFKDRDSRSPVLPMVPLSVLNMGRSLSLC